MTGEEIAKYKKSVDILVRHGLAKYDLYKALEKLAKDKGKES